ncbi:MAG: peptidylprolyl isomerase [Bacteroidales bacterium]|nr:peptidylprolyl isomerase [Bacteroidales bacterium]
MRSLIFLIIVAFITSCSQSPRVIIKTEMGDIVVELYPEKAPVTVENFLRYVDEERYGGATFYRVVRDDNQLNDSIRIDVIQGGLFDDDAEGLPPIAHETTAQTGILHKDGVISMARWHPGTATDDFFICVGDQPGLDFGGERNPDVQGFAAFGKVVEGMETVLKIHSIEAPSQYLDPQVEILEIARIK